eukprot:1587492-Prorocentrum_lima.AAC.1
MHEGRGPPDQRDGHPRNIGAWDSFLDVFEEKALQDDGPQCYHSPQNRGSFVLGTSTRARDMYP